MANDIGHSSQALNQLTARASITVENLDVWVYVLTGVFGAVLIILIICVIVLFAQVSKLSSKVKQLKQERSDYGLQDYKISRPKINNGNNYQRFTLPSKQESDTNSDVFFGSNISNGNSGVGRNPLSQVPGVSRQKSFNYEGENSNKNRPAANPSQFYNQNPTHDYYNVSDRSKFTY